MPHSPYAQSASVAQNGRQPGFSIWLVWSWSQLVVQIEPVGQAPVASVRMPATQARVQRLICAPVRGVAYTRQVE